MDFKAISEELYAHSDASNLADKDALYVTFLGRCFSDYNEDGIRVWFSRISKYAKAAIVAIVSRYASRREAESLLGV